MTSLSRHVRHLHASPYLLLTLTPLFWSANWIVGRGLHADIPPLTMTFLRWLFAIAFLAPFAVGRVRRQWSVVRANVRVLLLLGVLGVGSHNALAYIGLNYTTATNGVILNSSIPIIIIALSWIFLRQRMGAQQLAGVAISLTGVLVVLSHGSFDELARFRLNAGDLWVLLSMLLWSIYTILLRYRPAGIDTLAFLFIISCIGDSAILPLALVELALGRAPVWTWEAVAALASVGLFSSVLAYIFWNRGVELVGASVAGLFIHLMPVFGTLLAWLFLGERLHPFHLGGIAFILAGIYLTSRKTPLPAPAAPD